MPAGTPMIISGSPADELALCAWIARFVRGVSTGDEAAASY